MFFLILEYFSKPILIEIITAKNQDFDNFKAKICRNDFEKYSKIKKNITYVDNFRIMLVSQVLHWILLHTRPSPFEEEDFDEVFLPSSGSQTRQPRSQRNLPGSQTYQPGS